MDPAKKSRLKAKGWAIGTPAEFLQLTPEEERFIELKLALSASLQSERRKQGLTQTQLARMLGSSQSRVAKMEAGDPSVTADLLLKALLSLGVTRKQLSRVIAAPSKVTGTTT